MRSRNRRCTCEQLREDYVICERHNLFITDIALGEMWCSWSVSFVDDTYSRCDIEKNNIQLDLLINGVDSIYIDTAIHRASSLFSDEDWEDEMESVMYNTDSEDDEANEIVCFDTSISATNISNTNTNRNTKHLLDDKQDSSRYCNCENKNIVEPNSVKGKHVRFAHDSILVNVHYMFAWSYAYKQSRKSVWVEAACNRSHFQRRIETTSKILEPVLRQRLVLIESNLKE